MPKIIDIHIVSGAEGPSIQIFKPYNKDGLRAVGPKAWGNVYNRPTFTFKNVDAEKLCEDIMKYAEDEWVEVDETTIKEIK